MNRYILSIDQGTTSSRVVLYDDKFKIKNIQQKEFRQFFPKDGCCLLYTSPSPRD